MQGSRSSCKSICRAQLKPPRVSQRCASPPSRYRPPSDAAGVIPRAASVSTKEILLGTVSLGVGRVLFFYFFSGLPPCHLSLHLVTRIRPWLAQTVSALSWTGRVWQDAPGRRQPPPAPGWLFCFHPCLGMSSLGIRAGGVSAFGVSHLRWGRGCPSGMGITSYIKGSFQICSLVAGGNPASRCLEVPDVSGAIQGVSRHCRIIYGCVGGTFPPCCLPQLLRL